MSRFARLVLTRFGKTAVSIPTGFVPGCCSLAHAPSMGPQASAAFSSQGRWFLPNQLQTKKIKKREVGSGKGEMRGITKKCKS